MAKRKLQQYRELATFNNVVQPDFNDVRTGHASMGNWGREFFRNDYPIVLELGCGKGEYTIHLAEKDSKTNYIGVDVKGARLWTGSKLALEKGLTNVLFIRADIQWLPMLFGASEIDEIWIPFPDPQPKKSGIKKRLTHPSFLKKYEAVLKPGGWMHLKTDNLQLHEYTLEVLETLNYTVGASTCDLYGADSEGPASAVKTYYEKKFLEQGSPITYIKFRKP